MKQNSNPMTVHHLHPRSRCLDVALMHIKANKLKLRQLEHNAFHRMFSNMVPVEMIRHLALHWTNTTSIRFTHIDIEAEFGGAVYRYRSFGPRDRSTLQTVGSYHGNTKSCRLDWIQVFGKDTDVYEAMVQIIERWSPSGPYWRRVIIKAETSHEYLEYIYIPHRRHPRR